MTKIRNALEHKDAEALFVSVLADITALKTAVDSAKALNDSLKSTLNSLITNLGSDYLDSSAGLAIGSTKPNVSTIAFQFHINGVEYNKAAVTAGTALAGDDVPQNKYGAWALDIGINGTIDIVPATANGTGYSSAVLASGALPAVEADHVRLGFVTAMNSAAVFDPGTTELDAATVAEVYTSATPFSSILPSVVSVADQTAVGDLTTEY